MTLSTSPPLHVEISGPSDRPTLVLVHPLAADVRFWDDQVAALSTTFQVVRLDLPGHGRSTWSGGDLRLDDLAQCVISVIDQLGLDRIHYCGLSIGGIVGMEIALRHGQRLRSLTLSNCLPYLGQLTLWEERAQSALSGNLKDLVGKSISRWVTPSYLQLHTQKASWLLDTAASTDPLAYAAFCRLLGKVDLRGELHRISVPTLVIGGEKDIATPAPACEALAKAIPEAKFVALEGAHFCNLECPKAYSETLRHFIEGCCT